MRVDMFVGINLKPALEQPGCPICRIRNQFEEKYLSALLHEYVNDYLTRTHIIASLGYCSKHAWQMGIMERDKYGDAVGNTIIYENLVKVVLQPLNELKKAKPNLPHQVFHQFSLWLKRRGKPPVESYNDPFRLFIRSGCRVCQTGDNAEKNYLMWLLKSVSEPEPELREQYLASDGLCLYHLRLALQNQTPAVETGIQFLVNQTLETLPKLCLDLREYTDKHAWDRHSEELTPDECLAWVKAIRFFAGNEGNVLFNDLDQVPLDDRGKNDFPGKFG